MACLSCSLISAGVEKLSTCSLQDLLLELLPGELLVLPWVYTSLTGCLYWGLDWVTAQLVWKPVHTTLRSKDHPHSKGKDPFFFGVRCHHTGITVMLCDRSDIIWLPAIWLWQCCIPFPIVCCYSHLPLPFSNTTHTCMFLSLGHVEQMIIVSTMRDPCHSLL